MRVAGIAASAVAGCLVLLALVLWLIWSFALSTVDRVMILDLLGFYSVSGQ